MVAPALSLPGVTDITATSARPQVTVTYPLAAFVSPLGSNANAGTQASPFLTTAPLETRYPAGVPAGPLVAKDLLGNDFASPPMIGAVEELP